MENTRAAKLALGRKKLENHQRKKKNTELMTNQECVVDNLIISNKNCDQSFLDADKNINTNGKSDSYADSDKNVNSANSFVPLDLSLNEENLSLNKFSHDQDNKLGDTIATYQKSIEILINDKSELNNKIKSLKCDIVQSKEQSAELFYKVNFLNGRINQLEENLTLAKSENLKFSSSVDTLVEEKNELLSNKNKIEQRCRDFEEKFDENTNLLRTLATENEALKTELQQAKSDCEISQLHIQQVSKIHDNTEIQEQLLQLVNEKNTYVKLLEETRNKLQDSESDKNQVNYQYQQYVQQLNGQLESLSNKYQNLLLDFNNVKDHEHSLLLQMGNLEKQLQSGNSQFVKNETVATDDEHMKNLLAENESFKITNLGLEEKLNVSKANCNELDILLSEKELKIEELKESLHQLEKVDVHKLIAANESDRVAAQLATTQNIKLKDEMVTIQEAYNQMSNVKLELSQLLETEQNVNKDLIRKLGEDGYNVKDLQKKLKAKDDEMIRLQSNCRNLETELLHLTQVNDNLRHYEAISENINLLQNELDSVHQKLALSVEENKKLKQENALLKDHEEIHTTVNNSTDKGEQVNLCNNNEVTDSCLLPNEEAMRKLQERFVDTVKELAELSDEKQKLEHIVLQLQSETETICEYIALYHKQRAVLKQREVEKNAQLALVVQEKSKLMKQLSELKLLMNDFLSRSKPFIQNISNMDNNDEVSQKILSLLVDITNYEKAEDDVLDRNNLARCPCCSGSVIDI